MSSLAILTFHSLDDSGSVISFAPDRFEALMRGLAEEGWRGRSLDRALREAPAAEGRRFAITFDDGYRNVIEQALPCLASLGFSATVFAVADRLGNDNRWPGHPADPVPVLTLASAAELRTAAEAGWEIGSHGLAHRSLVGLDPEDLERELGESRRRLEDLVGQPVRHLAYPYGEHDPRARRAARDHYTAAVGTRLARCLPGDRADGFDLPRIDAWYLRGWAGSPLFESPLAGGYLALRRWGRSLRRKLA